MTTSQKFELIIQLINEIKSDEEIPLHFRNNLTYSRKEVEIIYKNYKEYME